MGVEIEMTSVDEAREAIAAAMRLLRGAEAWLAGTGDGVSGQPPASRARREGKIGSLVWEGCSDWPRLEDFYCPDCRDQDPCRFCADRFAAEERRVFNEKKRYYDRLRKKSERAAKKSADEAKVPWL